MARPIEATPALYGEDAERLLAQLKVHASAEEIERRRRLCKSRREYMMRPKPIREEE